MTGGDCIKLGIKKWMGGINKREICFSDKELLIESSRIPTASLVSDL
jgi:hypothetical protein